MRIVTARVRPAHPWVFSNEVIDPPVSALVGGEAVEVRDQRGRRIGVGYANPRSLICIRLLSREPVDVDAVDIYRERLQAAVALRARLLPGRTAMRVCAGESDGLPGLILDRYGDVLVAQITSLGMEQRRPLLEAAIREVLAPAGVVSRDDVGLRTLEGIAGEARVWWGDVPAQVAFDENGVRFVADLLHGQKTGFFFDQAENRSWMSARAQGARVLDVYAHLGGWALHALHGGAREAVTVDSSASANALIAENGRLNGVSDRLTVRQGDAREVLAELYQRGERFDIVCVDPPAFAKSRKNVGVALGAYKQVNQAASKLVVPGGLMFSSSCSHHVLPDRFEEAVVHGVRAGGRDPVLVRRGGQAADHPILPGVPETEYLKHLVFVVR